jgi:uncharacterized protein (TIGR02145 family)
MIKLPKHLAILVVAISAICSYGQGGGNAMTGTAPAKPMEKPLIPLKGYYTDIRDGYQYKVVQIGNDFWLGENLNYGTMIGLNSTQKDNGIIEKYCPGNDEAKCKEYGGLYTWNEMMNYISGSRRGICPEGTHLPTVGDWEGLKSYLGSNAGGKLKEEGNLHWARPNQNATNAFEFSALPIDLEIRMRNRGGTIPDACYYAYLWSATAANDSVAWAAFLSYNSDSLILNGYLKSYEFSVRCVLDK